MFVKHYVEENETKQNDFQCRKQAWEINLVIEKSTGTKLEN